MKIGELLKLNDVYDRMSIRVRNTVTEGLYVPEWIQLPLIFISY